MQKGPRNQKYSNNSSKYLGVYKIRNYASGPKWRAAIWWNQKLLHLGYFDTEKEAAKAYDAFLYNYNLINEGYKPNFQEESHDNNG